MKLEEFETYNLAIDLGEKVHRSLNNWNYFDKDTIGKQLVRSTDSIAANLSEGLGRYHFKERRNFTYYARGSLYETRTWLLKSLHRKLISEIEYQHFISQLDKISVKLNNYVKTLKPKT